MLSFDDPRWGILTASCRSFYDPRHALFKLEHGENTDANTVWEELWQKLCHHGNVGEAAYAVLPHLVRIYEAQETVNWNLFGIACAIEVERHNIANPELPFWLQSSYMNAWKTLRTLAAKQLQRTAIDWQLRILLSTIALANGDIKMGALLMHFDQAYIDLLADEYFAWSRLYVLSSTNLSC